MGYHKIHHISVLLDMLLAKEQLTCDRKGFVELLDRVESEVENEVERSDKQYLYKLNIRIREEGKKGKDSIQVKESCLNNCLIYLRYESLNDLTNQIDKVHKQVGLLFQEKRDLAILVPTLKKNTCLEEIRAAQRIGQQLTFLEQHYNPENLDWKQEVASKINDRATVWFISSHLYQDQLESLKEFLVSEEMITSRVLLFFLVQKESELKSIQEALNSDSLLGGSEDLLILIQLLTRSTQVNKEKPKDDAKSDNSNVTINTGGGIGIGVINTKKFNQTTNITNIN